LRAEISFTLIEQMRQILLLGGNQGDVVQTMQEATDFLSQELGEPVRVSGYYESEPWGFDADQNFVNQVVEFQSDYSAEELLRITQAVELECGRSAKTQAGYESRVIDIDILFVDNEVIDLPHLQIPHPKLHLRHFTLLPLAEKWTTFNHPIFNKLISTLLSECQDEIRAQLIEFELA